MNISVVIPTYNRKELLEKAITSVLQQTYSPDEIIVVDDFSSDGTEEMVKVKFSDIRYIRLEKHLGVAAARNRGIKEASFEWISFLDSDDQWVSNKIEEQMKYIKRKPYYKICHTDEIWIKNNIRINQGKKHRKYEGWFFIPSLWMCLISPSSVIIHKSVFDSVGYFDEDFSVVEDYELWLRVTSRYPVGYVDKKLTVKFGGHDDQLSKTINGIEKYRLLAIEKLIKNRWITGFYLEKAFETYFKKYLIYLNGCLKRGNFAEAETIMKRKKELEKFIIQHQKSGVYLGVLS